MASVKTSGARRSTAGIIIHHTAGNSLASALNTFKSTGKGSQAIIDTDGTIYELAPRDAITGHTRPSGYGSSAYPVRVNGLSNANTYGIEFVGADNSKITQAQIAAGLNFVNELAAEFGIDPTKQVYGHGEVTPGHRQISEGMALVTALRTGTPNFMPEDQFVRMVGGPAGWGRGDIFQNGSPNSALAFAPPVASPNAPFGAVFDAPMPHLRPDTATLAPGPKTYDMIPTLRPRTADGKSFDVKRQPPPGTMYPVQHGPVDLPLQEPVQRGRSPLNAVPARSTGPIPPADIPNVTTAEAARAWRQANTTGVPATKPPPIPQGPSNAAKLVYAAATGNRDRIATEANQLQEWVLGVNAPYGAGESVDSRKAQVESYFANIGTQTPYARIIANNLQSDPSLAEAIPNTWGMIPTGFRDALIAPLTNTYYAQGRDQYRPMSGLQAPLGAPAPSAAPQAPVRSISDMVRGNTPPPSPVRSFAGLPNGSAAMGIQPQARGVLGNLTAPVMTAADSVKGWLGGLLGGGSAQAAPSSPPSISMAQFNDRFGDSFPTGNSTISPELGIERAVNTPPLGTPAYNATVSGYRPMTPSGTSSRSQPPTIASAFMPTGGPGTFSPGSMPAAIPTVAPPAPQMQTVKTNDTKMVPNPAFAEWSSALAGNPSLWNSTPPPQMIPQAVTALKNILAAPSQIITAPLSPAPATGGGGGSSTPAYNGGRATSNPYYSSSVSQGPLTVGRNSSGQPSYVSGPSGSFVVNGNGTYTSLTTGKTFNL